MFIGLHKIPPTGSPGLPRLGQNWNIQRGSKVEGTVGGCWSGADEFELICHSHSPRFLVINVVKREGEVSKNKGKFAK